MYVISKTIIDMQGAKHRPRRQVTFALAFYI